MNVMNLIGTKDNKMLPIIEKYYNQVVPISYMHDTIGILGIVKKINYFYELGFRCDGQVIDVFEIVTKSTALACQNFMMALVSQGYDSCPMEGFDDKR